MNKILLLLFTYFVTTSFHKPDFKNNSENIINKNITAENKAVKSDNSNLKSSEELYTSLRFERRCFSQSFYRI